MPDERRKCPTSELNPAEFVRTLDSEDIQASFQVFLVTLTDGNLITKDVNSISADIVDLAEVDDIGAMDFEEGCAI